MNSRNIILCAVAGLVLCSCAPKKKEEEKANTPLTPQQEDQLKIDEDNVMTPVPG